MPFRRGSRLAEDSGQGLVEYALILALASLGMVFALLILQDSIGSSMRGTSHRIEAAAAGTNTPLLPGAAAGGGAETGTRTRTRTPSADEADDGGGNGRGSGRGNSGKGYRNGGANGRK